MVPDSCSKVKLCNLYGQRPLPSWYLIAAMLDSSPVSSGCFYKCWRWRWKLQTAGPSQWRTSRRQPPPRCRWWRCRSGWGAAGRGAGRGLSPRAQTGTGIHKTSCSSLRKMKGTWLIIFHQLLNQYVFWFWFVSYLSMQPQLRWWWAGSPTWGRWWRRRSRWSWP